MDKLIEYYKLYIANYTNFSGRSRRSEYWYPVLGNFIISAVLGILTNVLSIFGVLAGIFSLAVLVPSLSVAIRRLHDVGKSGWWLLIGLVPLVGGILLLVWACTDSQAGDNAWGPNPKA